MGAVHTQFTVQLRARKPCISRHKPPGITACLLKIFLSNFPFTVGDTGQEKGVACLEVHGERVTALSLTAPYSAPGVKQAGTWLSVLSVHP